MDDLLESDGQRDGLSRGEGEGGGTSAAGDNRLQGGRRVWGRGRGRRGGGRLGRRLGGRGVRPRQERPSLGLSDLLQSGGGAAARAVSPVYGEGGALQQAGRGGTGGSSQSSLRPGSAGRAGQRDERTRHLLSLGAAGPGLGGQRGRTRVGNTEAGRVRPAETGVASRGRLAGQGGGGGGLSDGVLLLTVQVVDVGQQVGHLLAQLTGGAAVQSRLRLLSGLARRIKVGVAGEETQEVLAVTGGLGDGSRGHGLLQGRLHLQRRSWPLLKRKRVKTSNTNNADKSFFLYKASCRTILCKLSYMDDQDDIRKP